MFTSAIKNKLGLSGEYSYTTSGRGGFFLIVYDKKNVRIDSLLENNFSCDAGQPCHNCVKSYNESVKMDSTTDKDYTRPPLCNGRNGSFLLRWTRIYLSSVNYIV